MKLNIFKRLATSRKKGLLASNLNLGLISGSVLLLVAMILVIALNVRPVEPEPFLRFKDELEQFYFGIRGVPFDKGLWYRPLAIVVFAGLSLGLNVYIAAQLLKQKWTNLASATLLITFFMLSTLTVVTTFIADFYDRTI